MVEVYVGLNVVFASHIVIETTNMSYFSVLLDDELNIFIQMRLFGQNSVQTRRKNNHSLAANYNI